MKYVDFHLESNGLEHTISQPLSVVLGWYDWTEEDFGSWDEFERADFLTDMLWNEIVPEYFQADYKVYDAPQGETEKTP